MGIGKKSQSKRLTCRKKYKIAKLVRAHNKKLKRKTTSTVTQRRKSKKDPGVPNRFPFKEEVLKEAEKRKLEKEDERQRQVEKRKKERQKVVNKKRNIETLAKDVKKRVEDFDRKAKFVREKAKDPTGSKAIENSLKAYYREVKKVIEGADVIIEVLDARDPLGSRCPQVEEAVLSHGPTKRLILLLNKIDLVPKENVEKWLKYLRNEFPVLPFKASTQAQSDKLSHSKVPLAVASDDLRKSSCCLGADTLLTLLGNYCHSQAIKTSITIGIVGFPNTGKSSIINSLKRSKACNVGPTPGLTRIMQVVQLDKHIRLLDSPGVVMATNMDDDAAVLRNCVRVESIEDPIPAVSAVVARCHKQQLMLHYGIAEFSNITDFLYLLAKRRGLLKKAGRPDVNKAAKIVLQDWNVGRITYYCEPPETYTRSSHVTAEIVTEMCKAFDIDALLSQETETLQGLKPANLLTDVVMPSQGTTAGMIVDDDGATADASAADDAEMSEEEGSDVEDGGEWMDDDAAPTESVTVDLPKSKKKAKNAKAAAAAKPALPAAPGNMQMNRQRKIDFKKLKKQRRRADNLAGDLSSALTSGMLGLGSKDEEYSFAADFK